VKRLGRDFIMLGRPHLLKKVTDLFIIPVHGELPSKQKQACDTVFGNAIEYPPDRVDIFDHAAELNAAGQMQY